MRYLTTRVNARNRVGVLDFGDPAMHAVPQSQDDGGQTSGQHATGQDATGQDGGLRLTVTLGAQTERQLADQQRHGESDARQQGQAEDVQRPEPVLELLGQPGIPVRTPDAWTNAQVANPSGSSSHHARTRRCTSTVNNPSGTNASSSSTTRSSVVKNTAMIAIASKSSTTARVSRNVRSADGR